MCAGFAIVLPGVRVYQASESTGAPSTEERIQRITLEQPRAVAISPARSSSDVRFTAPLAVPLAPQSRIDTSSLITTRVESSAHVELPAKPMSSESRAAPRALGPYSASAAVTIGRIDSGAAPPLPFGWLPPTQAERDSVARADEQRAAASRDAHRPMAIPLGGGISVPMPFGGTVRSREQRTQDSVIHDDYLRRLTRLAERVRAKRESTLAARTIAGRDSGPAATPKP
jgi:hypothetical protein